MINYLISHENRLSRASGLVDLKQQSQDSKDSTKLKVNKAKHQPHGKLGGAHFIQVPFKMNSFQPLHLWECQQKERSFHEPIDFPGDGATVKDYL